MARMSCLKLILETVNKILINVNNNILQIKIKPITIPVVVVIVDSRSTTSSGDLNLQPSGGRFSVLSREKKLKRFTKKKLRLKLCNVQRSVSV